MAANHNFKIDQGSDTSIIFNLKDKDTPVNLTGYSAAMQLRYAAYSSEALDTLTSDNGRLVIDPTKGKITAKFPHEVTELFNPGSMVYDMELVSGAGEVTRIIEGRVTVVAEVTRVKCKPAA